MKSVRLKGTDISVSKFVFGTAGLFNAGVEANRTRLLHAAVDNGFTHFDTAPYYGFGLAERDLSAILGKHQSITVTTKVGLYPPGGEGQSALSVLARKTGGRVLKSLSRPAVDFSIQRAQTALEGSLRRLRRDRVDIYMLHEPTLELVNTPEWMRWLEDQRSVGKVRYFGIALSTDHLKPFLETASPLAEVIQTSDSLDRREADLLTAYGRPFQITYAYVTSARARDPDADVEQVLRGALERNREGAIIVSTNRPERLGQYRKLLQDPA